MKTKERYAGIKGRFVELWQKHPPYALTKKVLIAGVVGFGIVAVWQAIFGQLVNGAVLYGMITMFCLGWWYALTHI